LPWHIEKSGDHQFCVHKGHTGETGPKVACHPSEAEAKAHLRALYANEPKTSKMKAIRLDDEERTVLVADTPSARLRGLGDLEELTTADGMLFSYDEDVLHAFTASRMRFPIMLAFYDKDGLLLEHYHVEPGVPAVVPSQRYRFVVEMPAERFVAGKLTS
jgi:uncharacterized membrane protein (UPF0127 family)